MSCWGTAISGSASHSNVWRACCCIAKGATSITPDNIIIKAGIHHREARFFPRENSWDILLKTSPFNWMATKDKKERGSKVDLALWRRWMALARTYHISRSSFHSPHLSSSSSSRLLVEAYLNSLNSLNSLNKLSSSLWRDCKESDIIALFVAFTDTRNYPSRETSTACITNALQ